MKFAITIGFILVLTLSISLATAYKIPTEYGDVEIKAEDDVKVDVVQGKKLNIETTVKSSREKLSQESLFLEKGGSVYLITATYKTSSGEEDFKKFLGFFKFI